MANDETPVRSKARRYFRRDLEVPIRIEFQGETRNCLSTTVSAGGMYIQSLLPPPVGADISISFSIPGATESLRAVARVVHCLEYPLGELPAGFGIQFMEIADDDRERIVRYVEQAGSGQ